MLRNYFRIAVRNLMKYRFISFINLFGLTVGLTCCLLILGYILHELSYDRYHKKADNIYRVARTFINPETGMNSLELGAVAPPAAPLLANDFKEIKKVTRYVSNGRTPLRYEDKMFNEQDVYYADSNLFDVFDVQLVKGNPAKALKDPYSIMMTEEVARKYFGTEDPLNKVVRMNNQFDFKVTGVYREYPTASHIHPQLLISFNTLNDTAIYGAENLATNWGNNSFYTYVLLPDGYNPQRLQRQLPEFLNRHIKDEGGKFKPSSWSSLDLQPLTSIHLHSHRDDEIEENGDIKRVYIFSAIALFILLIACINYMNLSTARSILRAKEIGVRKVVGARRSELIAQFLTESVLISWVATLLAFTLTWLTLPMLNDVAGQEYGISILLRWEVILPILLAPFLVGFLSGIYPALFLSSFQPIRVLKGVFHVGGSSISFRKVLVVLQFAISIILIINTAVVFRQLKYMQGKSLGFNKDHVVVLRNNQALNDRFESFQTALLANSNIKSTGRSSRIPSGRLLDAMGSQINRGDSLAPTKADIKFLTVDEGFLPVYGISMAAGRNFSKQFGMDTSSFLINEAAVKVLGLASNEEAVGKGFQYGRRQGQIAGVFRDFHFESLHQRILPMVLFMARTPNGYGNISIKISGNNIPAALTHIEKTWRQFLPDIPYEYNFLDDNYTRLYQSEQRQGTVFTLFSAIAIFIACLGLFGLSAFSIGQRIKEIGIRKVLGADVSSIVGLLSRDFLKLVLLAAVIAFPVAWYAMRNWLQDFAYRIPFPWWVFILAGMVAAVVAFFTISFQAIRAASANPVKNLRTE